MYVAVLALKILIMAPVHSQNSLSAAGGYLVETAKQTRVEAGYSLGVRRQNRSYIKNLKTFRLTGARNSQK